MSSEVFAEKQRQKRVKSSAFLSRVAKCLCDGGVTVDRGLLHLPLSHDFRQPVSSACCDSFKLGVFPVSTRVKFHERALVIGGWSKSNQTYTLCPFMYTFVPVPKAEYISCCATERNTK